MKFADSWGPRITPLHQSRLNSDIKVLAFNIKFHFNWCTVLCLQDQKPKIWISNFEIWGATFRRPIYRSEPNVACNNTLKIYAYVPNFIWTSLLSHPWGLINFNVGCIFYINILWSRQLAAYRQSWKQVHTKITTNLPYPLISKLYLGSNSLMAMSHSQTCCSKAWQTKHIELLLNPSGGKILNLTNSAWW